MAFPPGRVADRHRHRPPPQAGSQETPKHHTFVPFARKVDRLFTIAARFRKASAWSAVWRVMGVAADAAAKDMTV